MLFLVVSAAATPAAAACFCSPTSQGGAPLPTAGRVTPGSGRDTTPSSGGDSDNLEC